MSGGNVTADFIIMPGDHHHMETTEGGTGFSPVNYQVELLVLCNLFAASLWLKLCNVSLTLNPYSEVCRPASALNSHRS